MKDTTSHVGIATLVSPVERLKSCAQIFFATLHEIFDESAYAAFRRENDAAKARRPKCC